MNFNKFSGAARAVNLLTLAALIGLLPACGGGSGTSANTPTPATATPPATTTPAATTPAAASNTQVITIDAGPANTVNTLFTSVTVCVPGSATACQTIDHVQIDTGSVGLRLLSSVVQPSLKLPQKAAADGNALVECTQFADGYSWGPVKSADIRLGGQTAIAVPIQIIGDASFTDIPLACSSSGPPENTVRDFGANGILGIGSFANDCGNACVGGINHGIYYACSSAGCVPTTVSATAQVQHPVAALTTDNNGVVLQLPSIPAAGAGGATGTMILGIGTRSNNALGSARVHTLNATDATLTVTLDGKAYTGSFIDSGSNGYFYPSTATRICSSGFFCPPSPLTVATVIQGKNGTNTAYNFTITNADALFGDNPGFTAFPTLGGQGFDNTAVDLGLPFFFGRSVFTAIEGRSTPAGVGPYVAF